MAVKRYNNDEITFQFLKDHAGEKVKMNLGGLIGEVYLIQNREERGVEYQDFYTSETANLSNPYDTIWLGGGSSEDDFEVSCSLKWIEVEAPLPRIRDVYPDILNKPVLIPADDWKTTNYRDLSDYEAETVGYNYHTQHYDWICAWLGQDDQLTEADVED